MKRFRQFDILRILLTFSVVTLHVLAMGVTNYPVNSLKSYLVVFANRFFIFTVPGFIFLSGAMVHLQYKTNARKFKYGKYYLNKVKHILLPYAVATLVYHLVIQRMSGLSFSMDGYFTKFVFGTAQYHLYFIPIIVQFYLLVPLYLELLKSEWIYKNKIYILLFAFLINGYWLTEASFQYADRFFGKYIFFFTLGVFYGETLIEFAKRKTIVLISVAAGMILWISNYKIFYDSLYFNDYTFSRWMTYGWYAFSLIMIVFGLFISDQIMTSSFDKLFIDSFSAASFYFYLIHPLVLSVSFTSLVSIDTFLYKLVTTYIMTLLLSTLLSLVSKRVERIVLS